MNNEAILIWNIPLLRKHENRKTYTLPIVTFYAVTLTLFYEDLRGKLSEEFTAK
jgi:hypothetical protein